MDTDMVVTIYYMEEEKLMYEFITSMFTVVEEYKAIWDGSLFAAHCREYFFSVKSAETEKFTTDILALANEFDVFATCKPNEGKSNR
jgi:hypothetical protein